MAKGYLKIAEKDYSGYNIIDVNPRAGHLNEDSVYYFDLEYDQKIVKSPTFTPGFVPQKGQKCFVVPPCTLAFSDIRQEYQVKRDMNDADFIIFPREVTRRGWDVYKYMIVIEKERTIYLSESWDGDKSKFMKRMAAFQKDEADIYTLLDNCEAVFYDFMNDPIRLYRYDGNVSYLVDLYNNVLQKPIIRYSDVPFSDKNPMDIDALYLLYKIACERTTDESEKNLIIQLQALNQSYWRNNMGTTRMVIDAAMSHKYRTGSDVLGRISALPKGAKEMVREAKRHGIEFDSEEDAALGRAFCEKVLEFDPTKFSTIQEISQKINDTKFPYAYFYALYDNIVKFRPKCIKQ